MARFYECTEQIARVIEQHYRHVQIDDMEPINTCVEQVLNRAARDRLCSGRNTRHKMHVDEST